MKGFFCTECGKEIPSTIKDGIMYFYCNCIGEYRRFAYFRETESDNEIEIKYILDVFYDIAKEIVKEYLDKNVFISKVVENTHLDIVVVNAILSDLFKPEVK